MTADTSFSLLPEPIREALESRGYTALTAVQQAVTDPALAGKNLRISSQTGSGKTVAIGIVLAPLLMQPADGKPLNGKPRVLLIAPTRELAAQVRDELAWLYAGITERVIAVTGGTSVSGELRALNQGADIVVGTPGRMLDHVRRGAIDTAGVGAVVLDEADQMLDLGFKEELEGILDALPAARLTHMVSATFPREVLALAHRYQPEATHVQGTRLGAANVDISHIVHQVHATERLDALVNVLLLDPQALSLVFTRTRADAAEVADELGSLGFSAAPLTGEMEQRARTRTLDAFRRGQVRVLVATDVAARGIDVSDIARVVHYDAPEQAEIYTHRSGRTGRAGQKGQSILFVMPRARLRVQQLLRISRIDARWEPVPTAEDVKRAAEERLRASLQADDEATTELDPTLRSLASALLDERDAFTIIVRLLARIGTGGPCEPRKLTPIHARPEPRADGRGERRDRDDRGDRGDRGGRGERFTPDDRRAVGGDAPRPRRDDDGRTFAPFEINLGERDGAEARRIMAIVCRKGGVKGSDIGIIQIGFRSSVFEIDARLADAFTQAIQQPDPRDPRTQIRPADAPPSREPRERRTMPPPARAGRPSYPSAPWEDDDGPRPARPRYEGSSEGQRYARRDDSAPRPWRNDSPRPAREDGPSRPPPPPADPVPVVRPAAPVNNDATSSSEIVEERPRRERPVTAETRPRRESAPSGEERPRRAHGETSDERPRRERPARAAEDAPRRERSTTRPYGDRRAGGAPPRSDSRSAPRGDAPARRQAPNADAPPRRSAPAADPPAAPPATARRRVVTTVDAPPPRPKPAKKKSKELSFGSGEFVSVLTAQDLFKAYGSAPLLEGVNFSIEPGERVGLVGLNGSGKSTLTRILAGLEPPDAGSISKQRTASIGYLEQSPEFPPGQTVHETVLSGMAEWFEARQRHDIAAKAIEQGDHSQTVLEQQATASEDIERLGGWERSHQAETVLGHLGLTRPDADVSTMSGGERRRVALARLLVSRPSLAILDEPTNHLDVDTIEWLERYLIDEFPGAMLLITHDRYLLDRVATRTLELHRGKIYSYDGGYGEYLEAKAERLALEARTESNRQNFLRTEVEWLRRQPKARTTKQKARIDRAQAAKAAPPPKVDKTAAFSVEELRTGKTILELHDLRLELAGRTLINKLELMLPKGERMGIVGANGTGKTTLLRALLARSNGKDPTKSGTPDASTPIVTRGEIVVGQNTKIAYFDQLRGGLDDNASIFDNVVGDQPKVEVGGVAIEPRSYLERFLFDPQKQRQPVGSLSGGERARVALAKMLRQPANLVILDEPTNDLDVATLGALEQMLLDMQITALVVTHDRWFLDRIATSILAFEGDGRVVRYAGNYQTYLDHRETAEREKAEREAARKAAEKTPSTPAPSAETAAPRPANSSPPKASKKGLSWNEQHELAGIMDRIDEAEQRVSQLEAKLSDPGAYSSRGDEIRTTMTELEEARAEVAQLTARWEDLEARKA